MFLKERQSKVLCRVITCSPKHLLLNHKLFFMNQHKVGPNNRKCNDALLLQFVHHFGHPLDCCVSQSVNFCFWSVTEGYTFMIPVTSDANLKQNSV